MSLAIGIERLHLGNKTLVEQAISVLRKFGTNAHVYLPGVGRVSSIEAGNYLLSDGSSGYSPVDGLQGLCLDGMGAVGAELVTNGDFSNGSTGWSVGTNWAIGSGVATHTAGAQGNLSQVGILTIGKTYQITLDVSSITGTGVIYCGTGTASTFTATGQARAILVCTTSSDLIIQSQGAGGALVVDNISCKEVTGIHATSTGAARPTLRRGATNLLIQSENISLWPTINCTVTGGQSDPIGGTSAYKLACATGGNEGPYNNANTTSGATYTESIWMRADSPVAVVINTTAAGFGAGLSHNVTTTWTKFQATATTSTIGGLWIKPPSTVSVYVWHPQLEVGTVASDYTPTTTAAASNPSAGRYSSQFAGAQSLTLGSQLFTDADDIAIVAGIRCDLLGTTQRVFAHGNGTTTVDMMVASGGLLQAKFSDNVGTAVFPTASGVVIGTTVVGTVRKVGVVKTIRKNGAVGNTDSTVLGAATYANSVTIGSAAGTASWFTGAIGPTVVVKGTLSDADLLTLERFVASLTPNSPVF